MAKHDLLGSMIPHQHRRFDMNLLANGGNLDSGFLLVPDVNNAIGYDLAQQALDIEGDDSNEFANGGGIHIKKSHKGLFTQAAKRAGMSVQQYASHVLNNPHASATMKKRANFARNAAKWKHALGGSLYEIGGALQTNGTNFPIGITEINNGGSHEENPFEGVQMGVDSEGNPNLVEEGETVWDNYVFSNRIPVPAEVKKMLGLGTAKMTFADASKKLSKGIKERPNDPIESDALETNLSRLAQAQEQIRQQMQQEEDMREARQMQQMQQLGMAAYGGNLFGNGGFFNPNIFKGGGYTAIGRAMANSTNQQTSSNVTERISNFFNALHDYFTGKKDFDLTNYRSNNKQTKTVQQNKKSSTTQRPQNQLQEVVVTAQKPSSKQTTQNNSKSTSNNSTSTKQTSSNKQSNGYTIPEVTVMGQRPKSRQVETQQVPELPIFTMSPNNWIPATDETGNIVGIQPQLPRITADEAMDMIPVQDTDYLMDLNPYDSTSAKAEKQIDKYRSKPVYGGLFRKKNRFDKGGYADGPLSDDNSYDWMTNFRFAPLIDSGATVLTDILGLTNKPDYTNANMMRNLAGNMLANYSPVRARAISDYLTYRPLDRDYMANKLSANAAAQRRTAMNNNAANQAARNALLGSLNYSALTGLGDALMNMDAKNFENQKAVAAHNASINQFNSQQLTTADEANAQQKQYYANIFNNDLLTAIKMRQDEENEAAKAKAANRAGFVSDLGALGKETVEGEWIKNHPALDYYFNPITGKERYKGETAAFGGMLTKRKRKNCRRR